jgi:hypothetical protein
MGHIPIAVGIHHESIQNAIKAWNSKSFMKTPLLKKLHIVWPEEPLFNLELI